MLVEGSHAFSCFQLYQIILKIHTNFLAQSPILIAYNIVNPLAALRGHYHHASDRQYETHHVKRL